MPGGLCHLGDGLYARRAGTDHRDALTLEANRFLRPVMGVAGLATERLDAGDGRHGRGREHADSGDQQASRVAPAVLQDDVPAARVLLVVCSGHPALELDVAAQIELVGDIVEIALGLRLAREVLLPIPLLQQFRRKGVAVGPAFGIEARAGIAVPVPGAADPGAALERAHPEPEFAQLIELIEAGNAGADDDSVEIQGCFRWSSVRNRLQCIHPLSPNEVMETRSEPLAHPRRNNRRLSNNRAAADCIARPSGASASASTSCECPAAVRISSSSHDGDRTGTDTSVMP